MCFQWKNMTFLTGGGVLFSFLLGPIESVIDILTKFKFFSWIISRNQCNGDFNEFNK